MNTSPRRAIPLALLCLLCATVSVLPQDLDNATLSGKVIDLNHSAVVGASVSLTTNDAESARSQTTDGEGRFRFVSITPGKYVLRASMSGFDDRVLKGFELTAASDLRIDLVLQPKSVLAEQTVEAEDAAEIFNVGARPATGGTIGKELLAEIPSLRTDVLDLALLFGGTSEEALSTRDLAEDLDSNPRSTPFEQGILSLGGGTAYSNNLTVDGLDNNDDRTSRERFTPPIESVGELQIVRNQFSAEYGRASGGRMNVITKTGGKRIRGNLSFSGRDDRLNANSWYNNSRGFPRPTLRARRVSAFISGPFCLHGCIAGLRFAASYEFQRTGDQTLINTFLPIARNPHFALPDPNGTEILCETADSDACTGLSPSGTYISSYTSLLRTPDTSHAATFRIDAKPLRGAEFTFGLQLGRKNLQRTSSFAVGRLREAIQAKRVTVTAANMSVLTYGRRYSNHVRFQLSGFSPGFVALDATSPVIVVAFRNPYTNASSSLIAGNSTASTLQNFAESRDERRFQTQDTATFVFGAHILKFGADVQVIESLANALTDSTGTYNFSTMLNFTRGIPYRFRQNFGTRADVRNLYGGLFLNDEVRLGRGLNLTFGVRYETETAIRDHNNIGPRIAFAWDPSGKGRMALRMGAGIFYNRVLLRTVGDFARSGSSLIEFDTNRIGTSGADTRRISVLSSIASRFPGAFSSADELRSLISSTMCGISTCPMNLGFATGNSSSLPIRRLAPDIRIPESHQINIGYEKRVVRGVVFEANFSINSARKLWREYDANAAILPFGYRDWAAYLVANPFIFRNSNGNMRTYQFYRGSPSDPNVSIQPGVAGTCSTTANVVCFVNLNSLSASVTLPSTATLDSSNSIGSPIGIALAAISRFRPDSNLERSDTIASIGKSDYKGLVVDLRVSERPFVFGAKGAVRFSYTLSSQKDDGLNNTSNAEVNAQFADEWARGLQDRRHRISLFGTFMLPKTIGRLNISPVLRYGSSAPFNIGTGVDRNLDGSSTDRPIFLGQPARIRWRRPGSEFPSDLFSSLSSPTIGARGGTLGRNAGIGPRLFVFDLSLSRRFAIRERLRARPHVDIGNILNATVFSYGAEYIDFTPLGTNPSASQLAARDRFFVPTRTLRPRELRVGMRLEF